MHIIIDLCLLCLSNNKNLKSVFTKDSDGVLIEKKLNYFIFEHVKLDSDISKHICLQCLENINFVYNYRQQCVQNIDKLNSYMYKLKYRNAPHENNLKIALLDIKNIISKREISDNEINEPLTTTNQSLVYDVEETDSEATLTSNEYEDGYVESESNDFTFNLENNESPDDSIEIECKYIPSNPVCEIQEEPQTLNFELNRQNISNVIENNEVQQTSVTTEDVRPTNGNANPNRPFKCAQCPRRFTTAILLKRHNFLIHCSDKPFNCEKCSMKYADEEALKKHKLRAHTCLKPYPCKLCPKRFRIPSDLRKHAYVHTGESPYKCEICYRKFAFNNHLNTHLKRHVGTRRFSCQICTFTTHTSTGLRLHQMTHLPSVLPEILPNTNAPTENV